MLKKTDARSGQSCFNLMKEYLPALIGRLAFVISYHFGLMWSQGQDPFASKESIGVQWAKQTHQCVVACSTCKSKEIQLYADEEKPTWGTLMPDEAHGKFSDGLTDKSIG